MVVSLRLAAANKMRKRCAITLRNLYLHHFLLQSTHCECLEHFGIEVEADILSAHRTPKEMASFAESAAIRGLRVIIACAGGARICRDYSWRSGDK